MMVAAPQEMRQASPNPRSSSRFLLAFSNFLENMT
jgi:hypothetical protein